MNPSCLQKKRTMTKRDALVQALKNVSANMGKSVWQEFYVDRRGRLLDNLIAIGAISGGRCDPEWADRL